MRARWPSRMCLGLRWPVDVQYEVSIWIAYIGVVARWMGLTGISRMECAAACSLLKEAALTRSSSCLFKSSENPACSILRCADRPPSSIASSVIWERRRAIAPFMSSSSCCWLLPPCSSVFLEEVSAFCCRRHAAENRLGAGAVAVSEGRIDARRICELQICLPGISSNSPQLERIPTKKESKEENPHSAKNQELKKWQPQFSPTKRCLCHPPPRSPSFQGFSLQRASSLLVAATSIAVDVVPPTEQFLLHRQIAVGYQCHHLPPPTMAPKGAVSTRLNPIRLNTINHLRVRRPNQFEQNPCVTVMTSMLSM